MKVTLIVLLLYPAVLCAQTFRITPEDTQRKRSYLLLRDGSVVRGQIVRQDSLLITVRKRGGGLRFVAADQLVRVVPVQVDRTPSAGTGTPTARRCAARNWVRWLSSAGTGTPTARYAVFVFKDGTQVEGTFVRRDSTMVTVRKRNGQLTYFEPELLLRTDSAGTETIFPNSATSLPQRTFPTGFSPWLLTGLTALAPDKGRFYYRNTHLLLNEFDYGITRHWSIGGSFIAPVPYLVYTDAFNGRGQYVVNTSRLFTKVSIPLGRAFRLGINAQYQPRQTYSFVGARGSGTFQALATIGSSQRNVTVGYGLGIDGPYYRSFNLPNRLFLTLGVLQKLSRNLTLVSDNRINVGRGYFLFTEERLQLANALRLDRRRHAFDLGLLAFVAQRPFYYSSGRERNGRLRFYPYLGYNLLIGRS